MASRQWSSTSWLASSDIGRVRTFPSSLANSPAKELRPEATPPSRHRNNVRAGLRTFGNSVLVLKRPLLPRSGARHGGQVHRLRKSRCRTALPHPSPQRHACEGRSSLPISEFFLDRIHRIGRQDRWDPPDHPGMLTCSGSVFRCDIWGPFTFPAFAAKVSSRSGDSPRFRAVGIVSEFFGSLQVTPRAQAHRMTRRTR